MAKLFYLMRNFHLKEEMHLQSVLVVEDDEISFLIFSEYLETDGYKVIRAVNGKEAVSLVKNNKESFSLILMDIIMPVMNGFEAAKKIKKINKEIPIIAQTAIAFYWNDNKDFSDFDHVMLKPLNFQKLGRLISSIINKNIISNLLDFKSN
jgi:hypothetical protein